MYVTFHDVTFSGSLLSTSTTTTTFSATPPSTPSATTSSASTLSTYSTTVSSQCKYTNDTNIQLHGNNVLLFIGMKFLGKLYQHKLLDGICLF